MLQIAPCEWALKETLSFSSVIDFSSVFLLDTGTPVTNNEDKVRSKGHSVI